LRRTTNYNKIFNKNNNNNNNRYYYNIDDIVESLASNQQQYQRPQDDIDGHLVGFYRASDSSQQDNANYNHINEENAFFLNQIFTNYTILLVIGCFFFVLALIVGAILFFMVNIEFIAKRKET
jgi:hypothetical protein